MSFLHNSNGSLCLGFLSFFLSTPELLEVLDLRCPLDLFSLDDALQIETWVGPISLRVVTCLKPFAEAEFILVVDDLNGFWLKILAELLFRSDFQVISPLIAFSDVPNHSWQTIEDRNMPRAMG